MGGKLQDSAFQQRMARIETLVQGLDALPDPKLRVDAEELVGVLLELHGAGIERMLDILTEVGGETTERIFDGLAADELVGSLLLLHGLHPHTLEARVARALGRLEAELRSQSATAELVGAEAGVVRVRLAATSAGCGGSVERLRREVEQALAAAAPDAGVIEVELVDGRAAPASFIALDEMLGPSRSDRARLAAVGDDGRGR